LEVVKMGSVVKRWVVGACEVTVWANAVRRAETEVTLYNVSVGRVYRDREGRAQTTGSLRPQDVPAVMLALGRAYHYLLELETAAVSAASPSSEGDVAEERAA
jgi:hypothetical protein